MKTITGIFIVGLLVSNASFASTSNADIVHNMSKENDSAVIDGVLNEDVWKQATKLNLKYNINPGNNEPAIVKTEVYLYENGTSLFVGFRAFDDNPENIRAYFRDRDTLFQDDFVGIVIDTFNDNRRAYEFFVNPFGVQGDLIKDDTQGGNEDSNWDSIWNSAGRVTNDGYMVEIEIPFSALRFPANKDKLTWGIQALRIYPRDSRYVFSNSTADRGLECSLCQFEKVTGLSGLSQGNNFQVTPTLTYSRSESRADNRVDWQDAEDNTDAGVDVRWGINENVYLNATINPDFSQVEADAAQLDINNTFSLFVREKRPFFLDGRDYFDTQNMNLVHTRNINAPEYGVKLTGKQGKHTYGVLTANDKGTSFLMPGSQGSSVAVLDQGSDVLAARYRMDVGKRSTVGGLVTRRQGGDYTNTVATVDGIQQFNKQNSIQYQVAVSTSKNPGSIQQDFGLDRTQTDNAFSLGYRHNTRDYSVRASYDKYGEDFRADLGFVGRTGYERAVVGGDYTWYGKKGSAWTRYGVFGDWDKTYDADGTMLEEEVELHGNIEGPKQFYTNFGVVHRQSYWENRYYDVTNYMAFARFDPFQNLRLRTFVRFGDQIDYSNDRLGDIKSLELGADYKIGKHLNGEINYNLQQLDVDLGRLYVANQYDMRLNYQFNLQSYVRLIVQYTDIDKNDQLYQEDINSLFQGLRTELLYSYKINPQSLAYLGYTDYGYRDDSIDKIVKDNRKIFMKLSYAFQL